MKILLVLIFAPMIALILLYFLFPGRLVAFGRWLLRRRGGLALKSVTVDGRAWPYLEGGDPAKPLLLFVHGFAGDKDNWSMIAPYLTRDFHVIAPDLPGFGENERNPQLAYDIAAQTARLKGLPMPWGSNPRIFAATAWAAGSRCATRSIIRMRSRASFSSTMQG
jgi:Predicted hydrolases or acyltransferases (alpha/beta hydrolase superfamily)